MEIIPLILYLAAAFAFALETIGTTTRIKLVPFGLMLAVACAPIYYILT